MEISFVFCIYRILAFGMYTKTYLVYFKVQHCVRRSAGTFFNAIYFMIFFYFICKTKHLFMCQYK